MAACIRRTGLARAARVRDRLPRGAFGERGDVPKDPMKGEAVPQEEAPCREVSGTCPPSMKSFGGMAIVGRGYGQRVAESRFDRWASAAGRALPGSHTHRFKVDEIPAALVASGRSGRSDQGVADPARRRLSARVSGLGAMVVAALAGCATTGSPGMQDTAGSGGRLRLPPFVWLERNADDSREVRNFLGFLYDQRAESAPTDASSAEPRFVSRNSLHVMWPLYGRSEEVGADGMRATTRTLMPFVWASRKSEPSGRGADYVRRRVIVPPLLLSLRSDNYGSGQVESEFLWPLGKYFRGERLSRGRREMARIFVFRPFVRYERTWPLASGERIGPRDDASSARTARAPGRPGEVVQLRVLNPVFGYERDTDQRRKRAFFLGGIVEGGGPGKDRVLGFVAAEKGPATDYEFQALWQFFMAKRWGGEEITSRAFAEERPSDMWRATKWLFGGSPRKKFKLGPIMDYESDWTADRKSFSVLFGLVSYARVGNRRYGRFLWIIPWRP